MAPRKFNEDVDANGFAFPVDPIHKGAVIFCAPDATAVQSRTTTPFRKIWNADPLY